MTETRTPAWQTWAKRLPMIVIAIVAVVVTIAYGDRISFDTLAANRERLLAFRDQNYVATVIGFILAYAAVVAFSLPGAALASITGGFLFSTFPGSIYNVIGATAGATAIYLAARFGLGDTLAARMNASTGMIRRVKDGIDENQWEMMFLLRLTPVVPFFVANVVPALVGVPLVCYVVTTALGIVPGAVVYTSVGAGLGEVFARGETPNLGIIFEPQILLPILGLCALAALPMVIKAVRGKKGP